MFPVHERFMNGACVSWLVRLLQDARPLQSQGRAGVDLTACFWQKRRACDAFACSIVWKLWYLEFKKNKNHWHYCICLLSFVFVCVFFLAAMCFLPNAIREVLVLRQSSQLKAFVSGCPTLPLPSWAGTVFYRHVKDITRYILPRFSFCFCYYVSV